MEHQKHKTRNKAENKEENKTANQSMHETVGIQAVHHVAILASDYQKTRDFYVNLLGFQIVRENFREDKQDYKLDLLLNGVELEIFAPAMPDSEAKKHPKRPNFPEAYGLRHLAFHVRDVEAAAAELNKRGIATEPVRVDSFSGGKFTFFSDPDGLPLELHE